MSNSRPGSSKGGEQSSPNYQSLPTPPPKSRGPRQSFGSEEASSPDIASGRSRPSTGRHHHHHHQHGETPLPKKQLAILAFISLCEQTALNSISPYLPQMVASFPGISLNEVGVYVGAIASAFALAQFLTNYFWGHLSDRIGRKPVVLIGTFLTAVSLSGFGFCTRFWHAVLVQAIMGFVNGNQGVVSTCLGEITDKSNQSKAFTYLPVIYGIGGITGPMLGGFLSGRVFSGYPYLLPNLVAAFILFVDFVVSVIWLDESLEEMGSKPNLFLKITNMFSSLWQFVSGAHDPTYLHKHRGNKRIEETSPLLSNANSVDADGSDAENDEDDDDDDDDEVREQDHTGILPRLSRLSSAVSVILPAKPPPEARDSNTILLLTTFLLFQFANVSFNSVYPIFAEAAEPVGRNLSPKTIGLSLSFAGAATIVFQLGVFNRLKQKMGNKVTWRISLFLFIVAFMLMPFAPYKGEDKRGVREDLPVSWYGKEILYVFLGAVLLLKTIAAIGGLTSALLLITNSAKSPAVLGSLNGLAQTLSAAGRAVGPFVSGSLFSLAYKVPPKGEFLPFGLFASASVVGFVLSLFIRGDYLESQDGDDIASTDGSDDDDDAYDVDEEGAGSRAASG